MRLRKHLKPKKVKIFPKKILESLTGKEKGIALRQLAKRENLKTPGFEIRFFKHKD